MEKPSIRNSIHWPRNAFPKQFPRNKTKAELAFTGGMASGGVPLRSLREKTLDLHNAFDQQRPLKTVYQHADSVQTRRVPLATLYSRVEPTSFDFLPEPPEKGLPAKSAAAPINSADLADIHVFNLRWAAPFMTIVGRAIPRVYCSENA